MPYSVFRSNRIENLMNLRWIKLVLAALWLVPGIAFLLLEWIQGTVVAVPVAGRQIPLAWPFVILGLFNLLRWWTTRAPPATASWIERRRARREKADEPNPEFQFDDPRTD
jgi:hypothetical protein